MAQPPLKEQRGATPGDSASDSGYSQGSRTSSRSTIQQPTPRGGPNLCSGLLNLPSTGRGTFSAMPIRHPVPRQLLAPSHRPLTKADGSSSRIEERKSHTLPAPAFLLSDLHDPNYGFPNDRFISHSVVFSIRVKKRGAIRGPRSRQQMYMALHQKIPQMERGEGTCFPSHPEPGQQKLVDEQKYWSFCDMTGGIPDDGGGDEMMLKSPTYIEWCDRRSTWRKDVLDVWRLLQSECEISHGRLQQRIEFCPNNYFSLETLKRIAQALIHFDAVLPHDDLSKKCDANLQGHPSAARPHQSWWRGHGALNTHTRSQAIQLIEEQPTFEDLGELFAGNDGLSQRAMPLSFDWVIDPKGKVNQSTTPQTIRELIASQFQEAPLPATVLCYNIPHSLNGPEAVASLELPLALVKAAYLCPTKAKLESYAPNALGLRDFLSGRRSPIPFLRRANPGNRGGCSSAASSRTGE